MGTMAERLRWARGVSGLTTRELAELAGISHAYPTLIETGRRQSVATEITDRLAAIFGTQPAWLVYGAGRRPGKKHLLAAVKAAREAA